MKFLTGVYELRLETRLRDFRQCTSSIRQSSDRPYKPQRRPQAKLDLAPRLAVNAKSLARY